MHLKKSGMQLTNNQIVEFQTEVLGYYAEHGRDLPWRRTDDPYAILVSEVMLQQTQVPRVIEKYRAWIRRFPTAFELAAAPLEEVLSYWSGLGYNRRALYLHKTATFIVHTCLGKFPTTVEALKKLPGVGAYTAAAICVFAYNQPELLIETNTRAVFIHHFFSTEDGISDAAIIPLIAQTMDRSNPRRWFNALFDYGSYLKQREVNPSRKSAHYVKQSPLKGSVREVRGWIMKQLARKQSITQRELEKAFPQSDKRIRQAVEGLIKDGLLLKDFWVEITR